MFKPEKQFAIKHNGKKANLILTQTGWNIWKVSLEVGNNEVLKHAFTDYHEANMLYNNILQNIEMFINN